jgi:Bacterial PH domain
MANTPDDLKRILGPDERVELYIRQKIYHPKINVDSVVVTNERIILRHPHALGLKKDYTDFSYKDISNVILEKGVLRSTIKCTLRLGGEPLALADIANSEAEKAYGIIRQNSVASQSPQPAVAPGAIPAAVTQATDSTDKKSSVLARAGGQRIPPPAGR